MTESRSRASSSPMYKDYHFSIEGIYINVSQCDDMYRVCCRTNLAPSYRTKIFISDNQHANSHYI